MEAITLILLTGLLIMITINKIVQMFTNKIVNKDMIDTTNMVISMMMLILGTVIAAWGAYDFYYNDAEPWKAFAGCMMLIGSDKWIPENEDK